MDKIIIYGSLLVVLVIGIQIVEISQINTQENIFKILKNN